jgi:hypothetical protein
LRATIVGHEVVDKAMPQVMHLFRDILSPRALLDVIEDLVAERAMARRETCIIADAILTLADQDGRWKGAHEAAGPTPSPDVNAAIYADARSDNAHLRTEAVLFLHDQTAVRLWCSLGGIDDAAFQDRVRRLLA